MRALRIARTMVALIRSGSSRMDIAPLGHSWPSIHWWLSLTASDQASWASGFGSVAAAVAAVLAARRATKLALLPFEQQERERITACRSIAPALGPELRRAAEEAAELADLIAKNEPPGPVLRWAKRGFLLRTTTIERWLGRFDLFGPELGSHLSVAASAILNLRARVSYWVEVESNRPQLPGLHGIAIVIDMTAFRPLEAEAKMVIEYINRAEPMLASFGGGKTIYEI